MESSLLPQGHRLTRQRTLILETVRSVCFHPTAEQVYDRVLRSLPRISRGTVYRNLDYLVNQHLIRRIELPGEPARYDHETGRHAHFVCREKGCIYDIPLDLERVRALFKDSPLIEHIDEVQVTLFGTSSAAPQELSSRKGRLTHHRFSHESHT